MNAEKREAIFEFGLLGVFGVSAFNFLFPLATIPP
jgi:hypothetical protein